MNHPYPISALPNVVVNPPLEVVPPVVYQLSPSVTPPSDTQVLYTATQKMQEAGNNGDTRQATFVFPNSLRLTNDLRVAAHVYPEAGLKKFVVTDIDPFDGVPTPVPGQPPAVPDPFVIGVKITAANVDRAVNVPGQPALPAPGETYLCYIHVTGRVF